MKEMDILHENGDFWVCNNPNDYTVYRIGATHSIADSSYEKNPNGLSIAKTRCDYLANRFRQHPRVIRENTEFKNERTN